MASVRAELLKKLGIAGIGAAASIGVLPTDEADAAPLSKAARAAYRALVAKGGKVGYHGTRTAAPELTSKGWDIEKAARPEAHKPRGMFIAEDPLHIPELKTGSDDYAAWAARKEYLKGIDRPGLGSGVVRAVERPGLRVKDIDESQLRNEHHAFKRENLADYPDALYSPETLNKLQDKWTEHLKQQADVLRIHKVDKTPYLKERIVLNPERDLSLFWHNESKVAQDFQKSLDLLNKGKK